MRDRARAKKKHQRGKEIQQQKEMSNSENQMSKKTKSKENLPHRLDQLLKNVAKINKNQMNYCLIALLFS